MIGRDKTNEHMTNSGKETESESKNRTRGRKRTIIDDYSDEEEGEKDNHQVSQPQLIKGKALTFYNNDIDMQLVDVSPKHGGSSLQLSMSNDDFTATLSQLSLFD